MEHRDEEVDQSHKLGLLTPQLLELGVQVVQQRPARVRRGFQYPEDGQNSEQQERCVLTVAQRLVQRSNEPNPFASGKVEQPVFPERVAGEPVAV
ncbi:hypothetical protein OGAPHI_004557 [Ogataea philodendri]|uniref:Uncharacterized protein n=1 Tax=Ogataea philodendri TaxID=1378263 RepID=A0A9P8T3V7_9ASCO|nr:uncharacterized protein OGAPHI_004557 [Ogataea philodendri]KAH3664206.1 hypothetical protein OGAPHI_004557 [Ogataea philodendri]